MTPKPAPWPTPRIGRDLLFASPGILAWIVVMTALHAARVGPQWLVHGLGFWCLGAGLFIMFTRMKVPGGQEAG